MKYAIIIFVGVVVAIFALMIFGEIWELTR
jgi:hypothetical protein